MEQVDPFKEYRVVLSVEDQYSIWPTCKEIPLGWSDAGKVGSKQECLDYIKEVWVDMRPKSLKEAEIKRNLLN
jgi:MbtH protein